MNHTEDGQRERSCCCGLVTALPLRSGKGGRAREWSETGPSFPVIRFKLSPAELSPVTTFTDISGNPNKINSKTRKAAGNIFGGGGGVRSPAF